MVENFRQSFVESTQKRNLWKKFTGLPKSIRYTATGAGAAAIIFFSTTGGASWLANHYNNLREHWQARSENIEAKVAETNMAYVPLDNEGRLVTDTTNVINFGGIEKITKLPFSKWAGKLLEETSLGDTAKVIYNSMASDSSLTNITIGFYVNPDSGSAYTAALLRNRKNNLDLFLKEYEGFDRERSLKAQKEEAFAQLSATIAERDTALVREGRTRKDLSAKAKELIQTTEELTQTKETVKVYVNDEANVANDYASLGKTYGFDSVSDPSLPGLETKLKGDIKYNVEFRPVTVDGKERYEAVITHTKKKMTLAEKTKNLSFLEKYMTLLSKIKTADNRIDEWKARPWAEGLTTTITPVEGGVQVVVSTPKGNIFERTNLKYRAQDLRSELRY